MKKALKEIRNVRIQNNDLWMGILQIALSVAPEATKRVLKQIAKNDKKIATIAGKIAEDEDSK